MLLARLFEDDGLSKAADEAEDVGVESVRGTSDDGTKASETKVDGDAIAIMAMMDAACWIFMVDADADADADVCGVQSVRRQVLLLLDCGKIMSSILFIECQFVGLRICNSFPSSSDIVR